VVTVNQLQQISSVQEKQDRSTSTTSVPITVLLYNGPFFCGFNVPIKGLSTAVMSVVRDVDQMSPSVAHSEVVIHFMPLRNLDT